MDAASATIRQTLAEVKTFLAQEASPRLSEPDTKASYAESIVRNLGWESIGVITGQHYVRWSQELTDDVLRGDPSRLR